MKKNNKKAYTNKYTDASNANNVSEIYKIKYTRVFNMRYEIFDLNSNHVKQIHKTLHRVVLNYKKP